MFIVVTCAQHVYKFIEYKKHDHQRAINVWNRTRFRGHSIHLSQIRPWKSTLFHNVVLREKLQISFHREIFDKKKVCQAYVFAKACLLWNPLSTNHVIKRFQLS